MKNAAALAFAPKEVAHRRPGRTWKRTVVSTQAALDRLLARLDDQGAHVEIRHAEVCT